MERAEARMMAVSTVARSGIKLMTAAEQGFKGKGKQPYSNGSNYKGESKGKGYGGKSKSPWSWRPSYEGKGKKGKGYKGKSYGKRFWHAATPGSASASSFNGFEGKKNFARSLNISDGIPSSNTTLPDDDGREGVCHQHFR